MQAWLHNVLMVPASSIGQQTLDRHVLCAAHEVPRVSVPVEVTEQRPVVGEHTWPGAQEPAVQPDWHNPETQTINGGAQSLSAVQSALVATHEPEAHCRPTGHSEGMRHGAQRRGLALLHI